MISARVIQKNRGVLLAELSGVMMCMFLLRMAGIHICCPEILISYVRHFFEYLFDCWKLWCKVTPADFPRDVVLFEMHDNGKRCFRWLKSMEVIAVIVNSVGHLDGIRIYILTFAGEICAGA